MDAVNAMTTIAELRSEWIRLGGSEGYWAARVAEGMTVSQAKAVIWMVFFRFNN
jgi:hypothetical protein